MADSFNGFPKKVKPLMAAARKASGYTSQAVRYHILDVSGKPECGVPEIVIDKTILAESVLDIDRCRRVGCHQKWPPIK